MRPAWSGCNQHIHFREGLRRSPAPANIFMKVPQARLQAEGTRVSLGSQCYHFQQQWLPLLLASPLTFLPK